MTKTTYNNVGIRKEQEIDYRGVEALTREAFWNVNGLGCDEHYFIHLLRRLPDFVPELDFVATLDGELVGNIMYTRSYIMSNQGTRTETLTLGPLSVLPAHQRRGVGRLLVEHSIGEARRLGHKVAAIWGDPAYYEKFGFKSAHSFGIAASDGRYPVAHQMMELVPGALEGVSGKGYEGDIFRMDLEALRVFDEGFPAKERLETESQKHFADISTRYF